MKFVSVWFLMLGVGSLSHAAYPVIPNERLTPGALCSKSDSDFDGYRYGERIPHCRRDVSRSLKNRIYQQYGIPSRCRHRYTVDHFYPLSIGGNNSSKNLWPEHRFVKRLRMDLEQDVFEQLRDGRITQAEALDIIHEEKMNPPVEELSQMIEIYGSNECDRAALEATRRALATLIEGGLQ